MGPESAADQTEIRETDIVFDCKYCSKSLAIDYKGAGLNIPCSDCGKMVEVPIPEGMDISDIDKSDEEMEIVILNLRKSLAAAESKVASLDEDVDELNSRRQSLEKLRSDTVYKFGSVAEQISIVQKALDDIANAIRKISEATKG
jgi:transcription elongation factor Elf1